MKRLEIAAREYLAVRRAMGFKLRHQTWWLPDFVAFLSAQRSTVITQDLAVRWAMLPATRSRTWWRCRLSAIRGFARYRLASDPRTEVPSTDLIPREPRQRFVPCVEQAVASRDAARVGVLDDHHCRRPVAELGDQLERGIGVVEVVVA